MKKLIILLFIISNSGLAQNKILFSDSLRIRFTSGDESYVVKEMIFTVKDSKVYGRISIPNTDSLLSSETNLSQKSIDLLNSFIKLAENYRNDCNQEYISSSIKFYEINLDKENFNIHKFCDWGSFTYPELEKQIFCDYIKKLKIKKKEFNLLFSKTILGKWKENDLLENLKMDSEWNLAKLKSNTNEIEYFEILKNQKAILHRKEGILFYKFRVDVIDGNKYLELIGDDKKNNGVFVYGHYFLIVEVGSNEIKMIH